MANNPKIDVLMTTYNGEKYLKEQIESILKQTYKNINLIISDDCSTDNTRDILKEYQDLDKRIKVAYHKKNEHISKTTNDAIALAKSTIPKIIIIKGTKTFKPIKK